MDVSEAVAELERLGVVFTVAPDGTVGVGAGPAEVLEPIPDALVEMTGNLEFLYFLRARAARAARLEKEYGEAFDEAVATCAMMAVDCPGMILWLRGAHPDLHADLTGRLPDMVKRLWDARAPMKVFRRALADLTFVTAKATTLARRGK